MKIYLKNHSPPGQLFRLNLLALIIVLLTLLLIARMYILQVTQFNRYHTLSLKNQMRIIPIAPTRGVILDRNGIVLAENLPVYALEVIPEHTKKLDQTLLKLQALLPSITDDDLVHFAQLKKNNRPFVPLPLKLKLTQEEVAIFASNQYQFPGISIKANLMRHYPFGESMAHLLGYVGRINPKELASLDLKNYRATNFVGKAGLEKFYETQLHGKVGYQQVETDVSGRVLRIIEKINPQSGEQLHLTLDAALQQKAFEVMKGKRGAAVAIDPRDGSVLAMVSTPSFDPNQFVTGMSHNDYQLLSQRTDKPLYHRAVRGLYPPASTIKPFIALAGLEKGIIDANYQIFDPGWFRLPDVTRPYRDWKKTGHGKINLKRAIAVSCDTYFYQLGNKMGITPIEEMLSQFGFGHLSQVDLLEEASGLIPNKQWKAQTKRSPWYPGDTIITAIGQGFMLTTPLQLANAVATLSQKGKRFRPHLLSHTTFNEEEREERYKIVEEYPVHLKQNHYWDWIAEGMRAVIESQEGTGRRFGRDATYTVAGKTGTAQVHSGSQYEKVAYEAIPERLRDHSLFIAYAPTETPTISIAVIVENDNTASNIARELLDTYFHPPAESLGVDIEKKDA